MVRCWATARTPSDLLRMSAHAAGMMTVMVPDLLEPTDEMREKCHAIADSLHHVREMIDAGREEPRTAESANFHSTK